MSHFKTRLCPLRRLAPRHIDTARYYENEREVGRAVRESGIPREEIFVSKSSPGRARLRDRRSDSLAGIASKIYHPDFGYESTLRCVGESFDKLNLGMVDFA